EPAGHVAKEHQQGPEPDEAADRGDADENMAEAVGHGREGVRGVKGGSGGREQLFVRIPTIALIHERHGLSSSSPFPPVLSLPSLPPGVSNPLRIAFKSSSSAFPWMKR